MKKSTKATNYTIICETGQKLTSPDEAHIKHEIIQTIEVNPTKLPHEHEQKRNTTKKRISNEKHGAPTKTHKLAQYINE